MPTQDGFGSSERVGVFSGAGLSAWEPSAIATGGTFHRRLNELCLDRAGTFATGLVDDAALDAIRVSRLNLLARIENTRPGVGAGALRAMRVRVPSEAHLLAALHLARGGLHVTVNFDDGVERAYALLSGTSRLPRGEERFGRALEAWAALWPRAAGPLRTRSRPGQLGLSGDGRPLLVKLHGSLGLHPDGVTLPFPTTTDEPDAGEWGGERGRAVAALVAEGFVVVTGFSGTDLASRCALLDRLERGHLLWMSAQIDPGVRALVAAVDPDQPVVGEPVDALRNVLGSETPPWPRETDAGPSFERRLDAWAAGVPREVAAEALGWALSDGGRPDVGAEVLGRLATGGRAGRRARPAIRLADALARRDGLGDRRESRRLLVAAALAPAVRRPRRGARGYAGTRLVESVTFRQPPETRLESQLWAASGLLAGRAVAVLAGRGRGRAASVRAATVAAALVLAQLERDLPRLVGSRTARGRSAWVAAVAGASARQVLQTWADQPSGRRGALLEQQAIELEVIRALLRATPTPKHTLTRLARLSEVFEHVADPDHHADALGTAALACLVAHDAEGCTANLAEADRLDRPHRGVVELARALLQVTRVAR